MNYSIIIPHKNIPDLLKRCLDSIPRRDDVQIIIVDDNSDPAIVNFDQFPGMGDPHIDIVFSKEGKGLGFVLNVGLTRATGKWILFADADDFFNYCINDILDDHINSDADIIYCKHNSLDSDMYTEKNRCFWFNTYIDYWQYVHQKADNLLRYKHTSVWAKIVSKELIDKNNILCDVGLPMANDVTFSYSAGYYARSISADPRALYCTTIRKGSIRQSKMTDDKKLARFYVWAKRYRFFKTHNVPFNNFSFIAYLTRSYFFNKKCWKKANGILIDLGFTPGEILRLCIGDTLMRIPRQIGMRLFPNNTFLPWLFLKYKKLQRKIKK